LKNSTILFLAALLILGWFGAETYYGQNICVTSCISFQGYPVWAEVIAVAILPVLLLIGALKLRATEKLVAQKKTGVSSGRPDADKS
jgi:purine-cytosine permease-like protein